MTGKYREDTLERDHLMARLLRSGVELVMVVGPRDHDETGRHWVGAVLSVSGKTRGYPTVGQAVSAGLFRAESPYTLVAFDPARVSSERLEEARACTQSAFNWLKTHGAVAAAGGAGRTVLPPEPVSSNEEAAARARAYARNTRLKFERVYAAAQKAIAENDTVTALLKCRAARDLLRDENIYGAQQDKLIATIEEYIERLTGGGSPH